MKSILFLEDDPHIAQGVTFNLTQAGFSVEHASSISKAQDLTHQKSFDLIVSDLMLPDGNGLDFCTSIRKTNQLIPILVLTAKVDEDSVLECFSAGVNDYVKKPFSNKELIARIKAHLPKNDSQSLLSFGGVEISKDNLDIKYNGDTFTLSPAQHSILYKLMDNREKVVTREMLLDLIGSSEDTSDRVIDSHVSQLRRKLKAKNIDSITIKSIYSLGYRIETK